MTYRVDCDGTIVNVEEWQPKDYFAVGQLIDEAVIVRAYLRGKTMPAYGLSLRRSKQAFGGEEF